MRRMERSLVDEYIALVKQTIEMVPTDRDRALRVAGLIDLVRGFEAVKERNVVVYRSALEAELRPKKEAR